MDDDEEEFFFLGDDEEEGDLWLMNTNSLSSVYEAEGFLGRELQQASIVGIDPVDGKRGRGLEQRIMNSKVS